MKLNGKTVETTLYYRKGFKWVEEKVTRPIGIGGLNCQYAETEDVIQSYGGDSGVRVDVTTPCEAAWNATIDGGSCMINRTDYYKAALWANCLEQAYSDFTRSHGKYGKGTTWFKSKGDEEFEGGCLDDCMHMFYGSKASNSSTISARNGLFGGGKKRVLNTLIDFKKTLNGSGSYSAIGVRRTFGDPNSGSAHVYSIENVTFKDKSGKIINFTDENCTADYKSIDLTQSKLLLRNPWNSGSNEGKYFELTLENLLNEKEWTHVYRATVNERTGDNN